MTTILLTGFEPFGKLRTNVSEALVRTIGHERWPANPALRIETAILPTEFHRAGERIVELIRAQRPQAVVCCGVARRRTVPCFELAAWNRDDCVDPDNRGERRSSAPIVAGAPGWYASSLPYHRISRALAAHSIPHGYSDNGGGFVCNHVFYRASHEIAQSGLAALCGFIHWPPASTNGSSAIDTPTAVEALRLCLTEVVEAIAGDAGRRGADPPPGLREGRLVC